MAYATLDPGVSLSVNVALSNGNLTATNTTGGGLNNLGACAAKFPKITGKWYFECVTNISQPNSCVGIRGPGLTWADDIAGASGCFASFPSGAYVDTVLNPGGHGIGTSNGNRQDFAIDLDAGLGWSRNSGGNWNNDGSADPATGAGGLDISARFPGAGAYPFCMVTAPAENCIFNFGATAFTGTPPSGFTGWDDTHQPKVYIDPESRAITSIIESESSRSAAPMTARVGQSGRCSNAPGKIASGQVQPVASGSRREAAADPADS